MRDGERVVGSYRWPDLRFSISWKAYCFADESERRAWAEHRDDLTVDAVVARLVEDLRQRSIVGAEVPAGNELVDLLIDTYVPYPVAAAG